MKKLAIVLVVLTCLLAGALLPALAEANPVSPAAVEGPEKPASEAAPDTEPEAPKATREPKAAEKPDEAEPDTEPEAPRAKRGPKAAEKPDGFEAPESPHRHERPGAAHRHHGEKGPQARPEERGPRGPREDERPWHAASHCRRCEPERRRPHCPGCPYAHECPGRQDGDAAEPLPEQKPGREEAPAKKMTLLLGPGITI